MENPRPKFGSPEWEAANAAEAAGRPVTVPLNQRHYPTPAQLDEVHKIGVHYPRLHMPVCVEFTNGERKNLTREQAVAACLRGEATVVVIIPESVARRAPHLAAVETATAPVPEIRGTTARFEVV